MTFEPGPYSTKSKIPSGTCVQKIFPRKNLAELLLDLAAHLAKNILVGIYPIFREVRESYSLRLQFYQAY
jgi:hypothetical protein